MNHALAILDLIQLMKPYASYLGLAMISGPGGRGGEGGVINEPLYPVPVCVMGNLWLVKLDGFILQAMAKINHKFLIMHMHTTWTGIRNSKFS